MASCWPCTPKPKWLCNWALTSQYVTCMPCLMSIIKHVRICGQHSRMTFNTVVGHCRPLPVTHQSLSLGHRSHELVSLASLSSSSYPSSSPSSRSSSVAAPFLVSASSLPLPLTSSWPWPWRFPSWMSLLWMRLRGSAWCRAASSRGASTLVSRP